MSFFIKLIQSELMRIDRTIHRLLSLLEPKANAQGLAINNPLEHNSLDLINKFYGNPKVVKEYLSSERFKFYDDLLDVLLAEGLIFDNKQVVDVGCGPGVLLAKIEEKFSVQSLTGYEFSDKAIELAKEICPKANYALVDIYDNNATEKFDLVFCTEVLEHLVYPERAIKTLLLMVNENGSIVLTVPDGRTDTFLGHINFWSPESWKVFIESQFSELICKVGTMTCGTSYAIVTKPVQG